MNCEVCKVNKALVHITEIEQGIIREIHVCPSCAESGGLNKISHGLVQISFTTFPKEYSKIKCNICNSTLIDLSKKRLLGCSNDYTLFRKLFATIIEKIHGAKRHKGKRPAVLTSRTHNILVQIKELELQLKEAIKKEEFEKAAKIRDKIKELKNSLEKDEK